MDPDDGADMIPVCQPYFASDTKLGFSVKYHF